MGPSDDGASLDRVVVRLQEIRHAAGQPSFGDMAIGISRVRRERGLATERARVGRTTVYDAFRLGRRRLDAELVADIVRALGGTPNDADLLAAQCLAAQASRAPESPVQGAVDVPQTPPASVEVEPSADAPVDPARATLASRALIAILVGSVLTNLAGRALVDLLALPLYLDMVGTAFSAIVLGPWWGALVGVATNVAGTSSSGSDSLWFVPVNVVGALVWGYAARRWRMARSIPRFFLLNVLVAVVCTLVAAPIIVVLLGGLGHHAADDITASVLELSHSLWLSVSVSNLLTSVSDKLIAGFVSLAAIEALPAGMRVWAPTSWMRGTPDQQAIVRDCSGSPEPA